ncbi:MAG: ornithine cyclodeaminase [Marinosulfonomonas sp.]|nr:ornithine cyclodeaminase [Marinosulfonomonas sp.]
MAIEIIPFEAGEALLDWPSLMQALRAGHDLPRAKIGDTLLGRGPDRMLSRSAWIDGLGMAVKTATIFPDNGKFDLPSVNGGMCLYSDTDGTLDALVDFRLVTKWKTAGDSLLAAKLLARTDARRILIVGAGTVAHSLREAYGTHYPDADFVIWNRSADGAKSLAAAHPRTSAIDDLEAAVRRADIVSAATMTTAPLIRGEWLQPGQHIDLIGAYTPDMREADDIALQRARKFVDSRDTTIDHIGELAIPLAHGVISKADVIADFYDLSGGGFARQSDEEITLFKNGGGAHLDLMTGRYILDAWKTR